MKLRLVVGIALLVSAFVVAPGSAGGGIGLIANSDQPVLIRVTASDAKEWNSLGSSLAMSNETLVAAADGSGDNDSGKALYVYVRSADGWTEQQKIVLPSQPQCVATDGDTLAVGLADGIEVWVRSAGVWTKQAAIAAGTRYVTSLDLDGDTMAVGCSFDRARYNDPGKVFVYTRSGTTWSVQQSFASGETSGYQDRFGDDVSLKGDRLAVGAPWESVKVRGQGAAYIFERSAGVWTKKARLLDPSPIEFDTLGANVELDGARVAVSQVGFSDQTGAVYVWEKTSSGWQIGQRIIAPDGRPGFLMDYGGDSFGSGMELADDTLIVGAPEDDDNGSNSGSVYVLRKVGGDWVHQRKIAAPSASPNGYFGMYVTVDNGRVVVAMPGEDAPSTRAGALYAFDLGFATPVNTVLSVARPEILVNDWIPQPESTTATVAALPSQGAVKMDASSTFTYTPKSGWRGTDVFTYSCNDGVTTSNEASVTVQTWQPTKLALVPSSATPSYNGSVTLKAKLTTEKGAAVAGRTVIFEKLSNYAWVKVGSATTGSTGVASCSVTSLRQATLFRARTSFSSTHGAAGSSRIGVKPKVYLTRPIAPATVSDGRAFTVKGYLKPRHASGSYPVKLQFYRYSSSQGKWVLSKTVSAKASNYSTYSAYSSGTSVPTAGRWRVRAYHAADTKNAATYSAYEYFRAY